MRVCRLKGVCETATILDRADVLTNNEQANWMISALLLRNASAGKFSSL